MEGICFAVIRGKITDSLGETEENENQKSVLRASFFIQDLKQLLLESGVEVLATELRR
jgi:hypothetical protein